MMRERITTVFARARGGKSHSWLTPTISRSNPSANNISVAEGSSETIRIPGIYHTWSTTLNQTGPKHSEGIDPAQPSSDFPMVALRCE